MTQLEVVGGIGRPSVENQVIAIAPVQLKCPACLVESTRPQVMPLDAKLTCRACGTVSEFRELHESWCLSKRAILIHAFPELVWLVAGYEETDLCSTVENGRLLDA
jgi:hypothetical protein